MRLGIVGAFFFSSGFGWVSFGANAHQWVNHPMGCRPLYSRSCSWVFVTHERVKSPMAHQSLVSDEGWRGRFVFGW
ncbi:hypothetical protein EBZ35_08335 [bacterium]|nr:hypothetical protein [bacterium]